MFTRFPKFKLPKLHLKNIGLNKADLKIPRKRDDVFIKINFDLVRKHKVISFSALVVVVGLVSWSVTGKVKIPIATFDVKRGEFIVSVTESGEIKAANSVTLSRPNIRWTQSQIVFLAPEGSVVKAGDVLVQFDTGELAKNLTDKQNDLEIQYADLRKLKADQLADMAVLEADVDNARISYELAQLAVERMKFESEAQQRQAQLELERSKNTLEQRKQKIESQRIIDKSNIDKANLKIHQTLMDIKKIKDDIEKLTLKAPIPGLVVYELTWSGGTMRKIQVGDTPWPGQGLISLPDLSKMQVLTYVNEVDVSKVKKGQGVNIKLDAFPDKRFQGSVASVATIGKVKDPTSNVLESVFEKNGRTIEAKDPV